MSCVHVQVRGLSRAPGVVSQNKDGSVSLIHLWRRISQTIRSVQRSIDVAVDVNSLQRNISIIEAVYLFLAIYAAAKLDLWISNYTRILPRHNSEY